MAVTWRGLSAVTSDLKPLPDLSVWILLSWWRWSLFTPCCDHTSLPVDRHRFAPCVSWQSSSSGSSAVEYRSRNSWQHRYRALKAASQVGLLAVNVSRRVSGAMMIAYANSDRPRRPTQSLILKSLWGSSVSFKRPSEDIHSRLCVSEHLWFQLFVIRFCWTLYVSQHRTCQIMVKC